MHLKGRPVCLYAPPGYDDYDVSAPQGVPDAKLKLEWVYPFNTTDMSPDTLHS